MRCDDIRQLLSAYLDDQLTDAERQSLEAHLTKCPDCQAELELLRQAMALVGDLDEVELPEGFSRQLHARLVAAQPQKVSSLAGWGQRIRRNLGRPNWRTLVAAAACFILLFSTNLVLNPSRAAYIWWGDQPVGIKTEGDPGRVMGLSGTPDSGELATKSSQTGLAPGAEGQGGGAAESEQAESEKIIKTATMQVRVASMAEAVQGVRRIVAEAGGRIERESIGSQADRRSGASYVLRIPAEKLDPTLDNLARLGEAVSRSVVAHDVTQQYIDIRARLETLCIQEQRLLEIMRKADKVEDLLRIESELWRIRFEIESATRQLLYWNDRVEMSTVHLELEEVDDALKIKGGGFLGELGRILMLNVKRLGRLLLEMVKFSVAALPYLLIVLVLWLVGWHFWRRRRSPAG